MLVAVGDAVVLGVGTTTVTVGVSGGFVGWTEGNGVGAEIGVVVGPPHAAKKRATIHVINKPNPRRDLMVAPVPREETAPFFAFRLSTRLCKGKDPFGLSVDLASLLPGPPLRSMLMNPIKSVDEVSTGPDSIATNGAPYFDGM
jgi:hypothetical protein